MSDMLRFKISDLGLDEFGKRFVYHQDSYLHCRNHPRRLSYGKNPKYHPVEPLNATLASNTLLKCVALKWHISASSSIDKRDVHAFQLPLPWLFQASESLKLRDKPKKLQLGLKLRWKLKPLLSLKLLGGVAAPEDVIGCRPHYIQFVVQEWLIRRDVPAPKKAAGAHLPEEA